MHTKTIHRPLFLGLVAVLLLTMSACGPAVKTDREAAQKMVQNIPVSQTASIQTVLTLDGSTETLEQYKDLADAILKKAVGMSLAEEYLVVSPAEEEKGSPAPASQMPREILNMTIIARADKNSPGYLMDIQSTNIHDTAICVDGTIYVRVPSDIISSAMDGTLPETIFLAMPMGEDAKFPDTSAAIQGLVDQLNFYLETGTVTKNGEKDFTIAVPDEVFATELENSAVADKVQGYELHQSVTVTEQDGTTMVVLTTSGHGISVSSRISIKAKDIMVSAPPAEQVLGTIMENTEE